MGCIKTRGHFPSDDAATKLIWLALRTQIRTAQLGSIRSTGLGAIAATQG